jgi:hypothetical protein
MSAVTCMEAWAMREPSGLAVRSVGTEMMVLPVSGALTPSSRYCS